MYFSANQGYVEMYVSLVLMTRSDFGLKTPGRLDGGIYIYIHIVLPVQFWGILLEYFHFHSTLYLLHYILGADIVLVLHYSHVTTLVSLLAYYMLCQS